MRYLLFFIFSYLISVHEISAQYVCFNSFIVGCGLTDTIPQDAIVTTDTTVKLNEIGCYFICSNGYLKLLNNVFEIGVNNIYLESGATFTDVALSSSVENNIVAKSPSTINLEFSPLSIKCDSGVSVFLNGQPMNPYPCTCNSIIFDYTYIGNCNVGIQDIYEKDLKIFPNPATDKITLESRSGIEEVNISDAYGMIYRTNSGNLFPAKEVVLSLAGLPKGIYFIQVIDKTGDSVTKKIVLQ